MDGILELKNKLDKFKEHLKQEEIMSATIKPTPIGKPRR